MRRSYASGSTHRPHMEHGTNDNGRSSGSVVEASSPGGTACEANIPHMEHRTPRGVASTHPICLTTPEAAEKGGGLRCSWRHRAGASLRLQTRPPRALAEEFTSPSETLLRAVMPGSTQLPTSNVRSPQLPPGTAHRVHACAGRSSPHASSAGTRTWAAGIWHRQLAPAIAHARLFRRAECHPLMILVRLERDRQVNRRSGIARARWRVMRSARVASRATAGACGLCGRIRRSCGTCVQCIDNSSS